MKIEKTISPRQIADLQIRWGREMNDLAARLCGDPYEAEEIVEAVFAELRRLRASDIGTDEKMPVWIADRIVSVCLELTGNEKVADWEQYKAEHPDRQQSAAERTAERRVEIEGKRRLAVLAGGATRRARAALEAGKRRVATVRKVRAVPPSTDRNPNKTR